MTTGTDIGGRMLYLYGVVAGDQRLPGSELARLEVIASSDLAAIVEEVPPGDFGGVEVLEQRLQDIEWVGPLARKHEHVLEDVIDHGTVIPAPLCTLFSSSEAVRDSLMANGERFHTLLAWLEGRREWGLKIHCHTTSLPEVLASTDSELEALERALAAASPGQAYVLGKQRARRLDQLISEHIDQVVDEVLHAMGAVAADIRLRPLARHAAFDPAETMILNAAFLVDVAAAGDLHSLSTQLASRLGAESFAFELTGPWPPYSFCDDESARGDGDGGGREEAE